MDKQLVAAALEIYQRRQAEDDFYTFVQQAWHIIEPSMKFQGGWALETICLPYESEIITSDGPQAIGSVVESGYDGRVLSYCHKTNATQWKKINHKMKSPSLPLYDIILHSGIVLTITGNHPVFVDGVGYARAEDIRVGDVVLQAVREEIPSQPSPSAWRVLQQKVFRGFKNLARKDRLPRVWRENCIWQQAVLSKVLRKIAQAWERCPVLTMQKKYLLPAFSIKGSKACVLQSFMFLWVLFREECSWVHRWAKANKICSWVSHSKKEGGGERWWVLFLMFFRWEDGCASHRQEQVQQRAMESCDTMPFMPQSPEGGSARNFKISKSHVVSIERSIRIPESVYNIEVEDNNNYFAEGILVHNCLHLEELYYGRIKRLLINQPPRTGKSSLISVLFPVWVWIKDSSEQFMCISYAESLAKRDNVKARRLIKSKWFQTRWPHITLTDDQDTKNYIENTTGGHRYVTGVDGSVTGFGANLLICDDLNSVRDSSDALLESAKSFFTDVLPTRFNNFKTGRMVVTQQRTHQSDVSGWILANQKKEWVALILPMEFEVDRRCITVPLKNTNGKPWQDPRTEEGEMLWPERFGPPELKLLKSALASEYAIAGQMQQRPAPAAGGIIKKAWFKPWKNEFVPKCSYIIQGWDTASSARKEAAYSACLTMGIFKDDMGQPALILLGAWRKRVEFPELYKTVQRMIKDYGCTTDDRRMRNGYKPDLVLVEEKSTGIPLIQTLNKAGGMLTPWRPDKYGDKIERVRRVTHILESGRVFVPMMAPDFTRMRNYADVLVNQAASFPNADSRDFVDVLSMILQRVINSGWILHPMEKSAQDEDDIDRAYKADSEGVAFY